MKKVCMVLNGGVAGDARVKRLIKTISKDHFLDLFYIDGLKNDADFFNDNVELYPQLKRNSLKSKLQRHSFFYNEFNYLADAAIRSGKQYDIVYANDLPTLTACSKIAKEYQAKLIYDSHEIYTETINQFFNSTNAFKSLMFKNVIGFMRGVGTSQERKLLKDVDRFITVNSSLAEYFQNKYGFRKVNVVMNCPETNSNKEAVDFRTKYNFLKSDVILYYHGMINNGRGLPLMIETMAHLDDCFKLIIVGEGPLLSDLKKQAASLNIGDRIVFHGSVPSEMLVNTASEADVGINLLEDLNLSKSMASPNKLFEYIQAGIPVLCSDTLENKKVLDHFKIGVSTKNDVRSILSAINKILELNQIGAFSESIQNARNEFNWNKQEKILQQLFEEL
ncbi:MAG: glycosyltransferase [Chitinophagales bacterium]|nr:glycosyltransferase [Chitinophagales bacterium]